MSGDVEAAALERAKVARWQMREDALGLALADDVVLLVARVEQLEAQVTEYRDLRDVTRVAHEQVQRKVEQLEDIRIVLARIQE